MANLMNANLPSDDEEDEDFMPDELDSEDEAAKKLAKPKRKKRQRGVVVNDDESEEEEEEDAAEDAPPQISEHTRAEKKAKMDDMWSKLNQKQPQAKAAQPVNLAALCKPVAKTKKSNGDTSWMRQLGLAPGNKKTAEASKDKGAVAAAALAAAKNAASAVAAQQYGMETVVETRRFAGQTITVTRDVEAGSKEAAKAAAKASVAANKSGLDAVLESLTQAKKVTVLDKSKMDWKDFKKTDDTVQEELEAHKRSGGTYLERQEFLGKADVAEYERDRDRRLASDVRNRGRL